MKDKSKMILLLFLLLVFIFVGCLLKKENSKVSNKYEVFQYCDHGRLAQYIEEGKYKKEFELPGVEEYQKDTTQEESEFTWEGDLNQEDEYITPQTGIYYGITEDELNLVYAVVMQEGGDEYYSAEAVMSTIVNRVNNPSKWSWAGTTIIEQITHPMQYCYSLDNYWVQYLNGNVPDSVKLAVNDVLEYGPSHNYDCFRGYYLEGCEQISDNWYFIG